VLAGVYLTLMALLGVGIGVLVRRSAAAIAILVGVIFVIPPVLLALPGGLQHATEKFLPEIIAENSMTAVRPVAHSLSPWAGTGVLALYALVALGAGAWRLARRDA
jgi:hypothetical protein